MGWHLDKEESTLPCSQEISEQEATATISRWESRKGASSQDFEHPHPGSTLVELFWPRSKGQILRSVSRFWIQGGAVRTTMGQDLGGTSQFTGLEQGGPKQRC